MNVLRITARMSVEIASREQVHLDAILMAQSPDCPKGRLTRFSPLSEIRNPPIPIADLDFEGHRVPLCSSWIFDGDARAGLQHIVRRKDPIDVHHRAQTWTPSSGPEKNYMIPLPTVLAPTVTWICIGDPSRMPAALSRVRQIGTVRRHGYGVVLGWDVEEADDHPPGRVLVSPDGRAMRFLPAAWCTWAESLEYGAVQPPYWHPDLRVPRVRPGVRCTLREDILERVARCH